MEQITLDQDIKVLYVTASSFPEDILAAHQKLHSMVPFSIERKYFGISRPENGPIVYRAGATELTPDEFEKLHLESLILKKGKYIATDIHDYMKDPQVISKTFRELLATPNIDSQGYCVEWYTSNKDIRCMVRLNN